MGKMSGVIGGGPCNMTQNNNLWLAKRPKNLPKILQVPLKSSKKYLMYVDLSRKRPKNRQNLTSRPKTIILEPKTDPKQ